MDFNACPNQACRLEDKCCWPAACDLRKTDVPEPPVGLGTYESQPEGTPSPEPEQPKKKKTPFVYRHPKFDKAVQVVIDLKVKVKVDVQPNVHSTFALCHMKAVIVSGELKGVTLVEGDLTRSGNEFLKPNSEAYEKLGILFPIHNY